MKTFQEFRIEVRGNAGQETTTCPQCSHDRKKKKVKCLSVNISEGVWLCHHCGWSGSLSAGSEKTKTLHWQKPIYRKPSEVKDSLTQEARKWLNGRGITNEVIDSNKLFTESVYMPQIEDYANAISFPYYRKGELVNIKRRDGKKNFRLEAGAERILYGLDQVKEVTIITEGEIDKLSVEVAGFNNAVSVPDGAPSVNSKDYSSKFDFLESAELDSVKTWILAVDNDAPGKRLEEELARRFGRELCLRVEWPEGCKDANDTLINHGKEVLKFCIDNAQPYPIEGAFSLNQLESDLDDLFYNGMPKGTSTGWKGMDEVLTLLPGQMTIITGIPSHGKSEWMDALAVNMAKQGWTFAVYSPENHPLHFHLAKLSEKVIGKRFGTNINKDEYQNAKDWIQSRFWFIAPTEPTLDEILKISKQMVRRNGINSLIIDPWNEIEHVKSNGLSETEYISLALTKIRLFARHNGVHVFVVAHPTKLQKDKDGNYPVPTPYDISGSAHWRNKADNCITVWRDVNDETKPSIVYIQKVRFRFLGKVGSKDLFWDIRSGRFNETAERYSYG